VNGWSAIRRSTWNQANGSTPHPLAGSDKASQHRRRLAAAVAAKKFPIVAANGYTADRTPGAVVVDCETAIFAEASERDPVLQGVADRTPWAFR